MNPLPPNADELVSAYLDGEAAPDEIRTVEANAELMARVASLRELTARLDVVVPPPPPELKETHIAGALDAFDALFAADANADAAPPPPLTAVPPVVHEPGPDLDTDAVVSFEAARERRRPRRFNTGVIAAAAAAILLLVGLTAVGFGRNSADDVATTALDAASAESGSDGDASDASDAGTDTAGGLSEVESRADSAEAAPAPTALQSTEPPAAAIAMDEADDAAADAEEPIDEAAMEEMAMDEEEAEEEAEAEESMDDAASDDADSGASGATAVSQGFFLGSFATEEDLAAELDLAMPADLTSRAQLYDAGLFPGCQPEVPPLAAVADPTLVGEALVAGDTIEIHVLTTPDDPSMIFLVDPSDCSVQAVLATTP